MSARDDARAALGDALAWVEPFEGVESVTVKLTRAQIRALLDETEPKPNAGDEREALEAIWDDGNAMGLDGWIGPGRGTEPVDDEAIRGRARAIEKHGAGFRRQAPITDAMVEAMAPRMYWCVGREARDFPWAMRDEGTKHYYRDAARRALEAAEDAR